MSAEDVYTFLLTDIEGSTRLWEADPDAMRKALARHDALIRETVEQKRGRIFQTVGDSFSAAFARASDAVAAAVALQRGLTDLNQSLASPLRVRTALHTGEAEERAGELAGLALNRAHRLIGIGHGEQVLLSQACVDALAAEGSAHDLRLLGDHRLRELQQPETVYQLLGHDLRTDFPPLRSPVVNPTNLPQPTAPLLGRERELALLTPLIRERSLVTLTGAGGCGKTRLMLQAALPLASEFKHGAWLVELAALTDPETVPGAIAGAIGLSDRAALVGSLRGRSLLLLLDNAEHLLDGVVRVVEALRGACPHLRILVSSRERLGLDGECVFRVEALATPPEGACFSAIVASDAVQLFVERAVALLPAFALNAENAIAVAEICRRLDGNPLAIELAAARIKAMPVERLRDRLDDRFRLLTGGSRTALPRHQSLRALIDWSWERLSEPERRALERLSALDGADVSRDVVAALVEKGLLLPSGDLPETIRQYAAERLAARA